MNKVSGLYASERSFISNAIRKGFREGELGGFYWSIDIDYRNESKEDIKGRIEDMGVGIYRGLMESDELGYIVSWEREEDDILGFGGTQVLMELIDMGYLYGRVGSMEWIMYSKEEYILDPIISKTFLMADGKFLDTDLFPKERKCIELSISSGIYEGQLENLIWLLEEEVSTGEWFLYFKRI